MITRITVLGIVLIAISCALFAGLGHAESARRPLEARAIHERAVRATVVVKTRHGLGTGWLIENPTPVIVTNRHVIDGSRGSVKLGFYQGSGDRRLWMEGRVVYRSDKIDLALIKPREALPEGTHQLRVSSSRIVRGDRVVLAGHPGLSPGEDALFFQTTEGVLTGVTPEVRGFRACGERRNCLVIDSASFHGGSGGPALGPDGEVVGMLWGGPVQTLKAATTRGAEVQLPAWVSTDSFAFLIHADSIRQEFDKLRARRR